MVLPRECYLALPKPKESRTKSDSALKTGWMMAYSIPHRQTALRSVSKKVSDSALMMVWPKRSAYSMECCLM
jgi:hypothetical protein